MLKPVVEINLFDEVEEYTDCTVQILRNSITGQESIGWWRNDNPPKNLNGSDK